MSYPIEWIREQFPALRTGEALLDNAAGSQVPRHVVDMVSRALVEWNANRGAAHRASVEITERRDEGKVRLAELLGGVSPDTVLYGPNTTTLLTLLADGWRRRLQPGDEVVVTGLDHQSNVDPWSRLNESGIVVKRWEVRLPDAVLDLEDLAPLCGPRTRLLAMTAASNALGTRPPVRAAADLAHAAGAHVCVDAVHASAHTLPDVAALGADMLVLSPYKVFGPHLGVAYVSEELLGSLPHHGLAFMEQGQDVTWETGTQNHEAIAGLLGTFAYLDELAERTGGGMRGAFGAFAKYERAVAERMISGLRDAGAELYGLPSTEGRTATVSFNMPGERARDVAERLAGKGVAVSDGHYYAWHLMMRTLGLSARGGAVRASAVHYNTVDDVDRLLEALA